MSPAAVGAFARTAPGGPAAGDAGPPLARDLLWTLGGDTRRDGALDAAEQALGRRDTPSEAPVPDGIENLRTARRVLDAAHGPGDRLQRAADVARLRALAAAGPDLSARTSGAPHGAPSDTVRTLLTRHDVEASPEHRAALEELDRLDPSVRDALVRLVDAHLDLERATERAFAGADPARLAALALSPDPRAPRSSDALDGAGVDLGPVVARQADVVSAAAALDRAVATSGPLPAVAVEEAMCPAFALDLGGSDSTYTADCALVVDVGGNDTYHNNAGGSNLEDGSCALLTGGSAAALVDLGAGADAYGDPAAVRGCGANGGGRLGAGVLVDGGGSDVYAARHAGTNGGGNLGAGLLVDADGDDERAAAADGTNGGGSVGRGALLDLGGRDRYVADGSGTNGGGSVGVGFLLDASGDDTYDAGSGGTNGGSRGGTGTLVDVRGNDTYDAGGGGANGGGSLGSGLLVDGAGDDLYVAASQATNGGATGHGVGVLVDVSGSDTYRAKVHGTNGGVSGRGVGVLVDATGDDTYAGAPVTVLSADGTSSSASSSASGSGPLLPDEPGRRTTYVVGLAEDTPIPDPGARLLGGRVEEVDRTLRFAVVSTASPRELLVEAGRAADTIRYVERDGQNRATFNPNDPWYGSQYGVRHVEAPPAWNHEVGSSDVKVCVVDSGIDHAHVDLKAGYLDGKDFVNGDDDPMDDNGHGTHVSGTIGARIDNGHGIAGLGNVSLLAAKVLGSGGSGSDSDIAQGIRWCADQGADVISMSLGGSPSATEKSAVEYAWDQGALLVASAGNSGCAGCVGHPAAYPEVVAVTCTNRNKNLCSFSSYGIDAELAAPGADILSTLPGGYGRMSGTSMSAPHVSGVAALAKSFDGSLTNLQLRRLLAGTADDRGPTGCDIKYGYGLVSADDALAAIRAGDVPTADDLPACPTLNFGANGGARDGGAGLLVDGLGDDTYHAGTGGVNGGASLGAGLLADGGGSDTYEDQEGGTGTDRTVAPKGLAGAQVDVGPLAASAATPATSVPAAAPAPAEALIKA